MSDETASQFNATEQQILDGALRVLGTRGAAKLSMTAVAEEAGVSRGTLYRYFSSSEQVFEGIGRHVREGVGQRLAAVQRSESSGVDRMIEVVEALRASVFDYPQAQRLIEVEPGFALDSLRRNLPWFTELVAEALQAALAPLADDPRCTVDASDVAELIIRLVLTDALLVTDPPRDPGAGIAEMWRGFTDALASGGD